MYFKWRITPTHPVYHHPAPPHTVPDLFLRRCEWFPVLLHTMCPQLRHGGPEHPEGLRGPGPGPVLLRGYVRTSVCTTPDVLILLLFDPFEFTDVSLMSLIPIPIPIPSLLLIPIPIPSLLPIPISVPTNRSDSRLLDGWVRSLLHTPPLLH